MHGNVEPLLQGCLILSLFTGFTNGIQFLIVQLQTAYLVAAKLGQVIGDIFLGRYSCEYAERIRWRWDTFSQGMSHQRIDQYDFLAICVEIRREDSIPASSRYQFYD